MAAGHNGRCRTPPDGSGPPAGDRGRSTARAPSTRSAGRRRRHSPRSTRRSRSIVDKSGTGGGFGKYLRERGRHRRRLPARQARGGGQGQGAGARLGRFLVGYDGITVVVNPKNNFVKELSVEQLKKLFEPDSKVKTWKDLDPSWPDREITFYCPDKDSGTFEFFTEAIVGKAKSQREDVQASSDDNTLVKGVAGDDDGIGYFGYAYFKANAEKLRAIPIKKTNDAPAVAPNPETILAKTYAPLSRPLYIYVKKSSMRRPGVAAFVKYYIENVADPGHEGQVRRPDPDDVDDRRGRTEKTPLKPASSRPRPGPIFEDPTFESLARRHGDRPAPPLVGSDRRSVEVQRALRLRVPARPARRSRS